MLWNGISPPYHSSVFPLESCLSIKIISVYPSTKKESFNSLTYHYPCTFTHPRLSPASGLMRKRFVNKLELRALLLYTVHRTR